MNTMLNSFCREEQGQDLIEYTLLVAFVCLATAALSRILFTYHSNTFHLSKRPNLHDKGLV